VQDLYWYEGGQRQNFTLLKESSAHSASPDDPVSGATVTALWRPTDVHLDLFVTDTTGVVGSTWWKPVPGWQPIETEAKWKAHPCEDGLFLSKAFRMNQYQV
jgi:hypothetical protein